MSTEEVFTLQCLFMTNIEDESLHVEQTPISLPSSSTRKDLNVLINKLLATSEKLKFEFIIKDQMLRSSLGDLLQGASNEAQLEIYYTFAIHKPTLEQEKDNEEWIKCVGVEINFDEEQLLTATGLFSGVVNVFDHEFNQKCSKQVFESQVNDLKIVSIENQKVLISCSNEIKVHTINEKFSLMHAGQVDLQSNSVSVCPTDHNAIASVGDDGNLSIVNFD